ncbi:MaoC family dehydratase [Algicella marina]|uniref:Uncharacterized protein n=1 Tax=Algicella marina TaxID=2683284 RepID=A0A6P1T3F4_9RHOB|nr:MaoC family dehydratase [Algicella marina]QHQ36265.1 hypothetical protein GO499_14335 [Algicella marina]
MTKTNAGHFFEDYQVGMEIVHATPRTVTAGDRALYGSLYPNRFALHSSNLFAQACGLPESPMDDLLSFHVVFGKTVPDISLNAVANLGYAEGRFLRPVYAGETLRSVSQVIGLKENSNGKTGIVWVRTTGLDGQGDPVLEYCRWVMVRKRDTGAAAPETVVPELAAKVEARDLKVPEGLNFSNYDKDLAGSTHMWEDYAPGEVIDHVDGVTLEEAEHMMATRLWQNTAKVHFDATLREDGKRLIYGGHIISLARALSFNGLGNAQMIAGINAGAHANPAHSGMTVFAWSEILAAEETSRPDVGALRVRMVASSERGMAGKLRDDSGRYLPSVLLDLDLWLLVPRST